MRDNPKTVLVASDFSPRADLALPRAWRIAAEHNAALVALHVVEPVGGPGVPSAWELLGDTPEEAQQRYRREAETLLRRQLDHNPVPRPRSVTSRTRVGRPFLEIVEAARECSADLLVLGAHGHHFLRNLLLGTTAENVVRAGDRPVLVVRKKPAHPYRRILVPIDFSEASRAALMFARRLAPGAAMTVMHVYEIPYEGRSRIAGTTTEQLTAMRRAQEHALAQKLHDFVRAAEMDPDTVTRLVRHGYPGATIAPAASELRADLVAVATHGQSGLPHMLLGSVAKRALREAHGDVLVVRP